MYRRTSSPSASPRLLPLWATQIALFSPQPPKAFATAVHRLPCSPPHRPIPNSTKGPSLLRICKPVMHIHAAEEGLRRPTPKHSQPYACGPHNVLHQPLWSSGSAFEKYDHHVGSAAATPCGPTDSGCGLLRQAASALNYGAIPPPGAAALLCPLTAGGASRLVPERDPGIHAPAGGATAGGPAH